MRHQQSKQTLFPNSLLFSVCKDKKERKNIFQGELSEGKLTLHRWGINTAGNIHVRRRDTKMTQNLDGLF